MNRLSTYIHTPRSNRWLSVCRSGTWRKRYITISLLLFLAWLISHSLSRSLVSGRTRVYTELQRLATSTSLLTQRSISDAESSPWKSDIAKVTKATGNLSEIYERALLLQMLHSELHGYETFVLEHDILDPAYTKPAYLLSLILSELQKPLPADRIQWLVWFNLDIVLLNPHIPLEVFLPPPDLGLETVHALVTNDHNGLQTGAFFLRVSKWAARMLMDVIALPEVKPDVELKYGEQSAFEILLQDPKNRERAVWVPQHWFNGYVGNRDARLVLKGEEPGAARKGDLQIHFAGKRKDRMEQFLEIAESKDPRWEMSLERTGLIEEAREFWVEEAIKRGYEVVEDEDEEAVALEAEEMSL